MAVPTRRTWGGAIELAGFPINVDVFPMIKGTKAPEMKMIDPEDKLPVSQKLVNSKGDEVARDDTWRAAPFGGQLIPLDPSTVEKIRGATKTTVLEATWPMRDTVPLHLAETSYHVIPAEKIKGSDKPVNILWNGLRASGRVVVAEWVKRAGSPGDIVVIEATATGLVAHSLPYLDRVYDRPGEWVPEVDKKAAATFTAFLEASEANVEEFNHAGYVDTFRWRYEEAVEKAAAGVEITLPDEPESAPAGLDLLAAMEAATKAKPKARKSRAKKAVKA